jgi:hypothetical protein
MFPLFLDTTIHGISSIESDGKRTPIRKGLEFVNTAPRTFARGLSRTFVPYLPFALIVASIYCSLMYHETLIAAVHYVRLGTGHDVGEILEKTPFDQIPYSTRLSVYYMGIFITAESAFILMAIKEYLQDVVGLTDFLILTGAPHPEGMSPTEVLLRDGAWRTQSSGEVKLPDANVVKPVNDLTERA